MSKKVAGVIAFSVNSVNFDVVDSITYEVGGFRREPMPVLSGNRAQYKEIPIDGTIKANIRDTGSTGAADWMAYTDATVIARLGNGKTVTGTGMYVSDSIEVSGTDAVFSVTFIGAEVLES